MENEQFQFRGLIKCRNCGKNYKTKNLRGKLAYECSGYANYSKNFCIGHRLYEDDLIYTASKHLSIMGKRVEGNLRDFVKLIEVKGRGYQITYFDDSISIINSEDEYGVKVKY